jgi:membrane protease YdiL (CAAX protease family)
LNELEFLNKRVRYAGEAWTAVSFCAWHWLVLRLLLKPGWAEAAVVGVLAVGIACPWIYRKTGSIILAILCHALVFDLALIVVLCALQVASS